MLNVVTGGAGFIGTHLVQDLVSQGERVRVLDIVPPREISSEVDFIQGSVTDPETVAKAFRGADAVFHLAANAHLWAPDKTEFQTFNVGGTRCILDAAVRAGIKHIVHVSSLTVLVGRNTGLKNPATVTENHILTADDMLGAYPLSKFQADKLALAAANEGHNVRIVLPTLPVGPGDFGLTAPSKMILDLVNAATPATLSCLLNLIDVRDVAAGMILARDQGQAGEKYILGNQNMWIHELLALLHDLSGTPMPSFRVPYAVALIAGALNEWTADHITRRPPTAPLTGVRLARRRVKFDTTKAATRLGLKCRPIEISLADQLKWFGTQGLLTGRQLPAA